MNNSQIPFDQKEGTERLQKFTEDYLDLALDNSSGQARRVTEAEFSVDSDMSESILKHTKSAMKGKSSGSSMKVEYRVKGDEGK